MAKRSGSLERASAFCRRRTPLTLTSLSRIQALFLITSLVVTVSIAYASPVDPSWIAGLHDANDYDEFVNLLTETSGAHDVAVVRKRLGATNHVGEQVCLRIEVASYPIVPGRSPPADDHGCCRDAHSAGSLACRCAVLSYFGSSRRRRGLGRSRGHDGGSRMGHRPDASDDADRRECEDACFGGGRPFIFVREPC